MSIKNIEGVNYGRALPDEWGGLVQDTQLFLHGQPPDELAIHSLSERLNILDNEVLEENRYYGLGLAMCGLMRAIGTPGIRSQLIEDIAISLQLHPAPKAGHLRNKRGLDIGEPGRLATSEPFEKLIAATNRALPTEVRFLADGLQTVANYRSFGRRFPNAEPLSETFFEETIVKDPVAERLNETVTDASRIVLNLAAQKYYNHLFFNPGKRQLPSIESDWYDFRHTVSDLMDAGLDKAQLTKVAMSAATVRFDEFRNTVQEMVTVDDAGNITFNRTGLPAADKLKPVPEILHVQRLTCPALQVRGLIPAMMQIIPDAVRLADTRIATNKRAIMPDDY